MHKTYPMAQKSFVLTNKNILVQGLWIVTFTVLTAIGAQIEIPYQPVPLTLQTFFVLLAGAILGKRNGTLSMCLYLLVGVIGLPVFSGWSFGFAKIIGPTGGYLLSFPIAAFIIGYLNQRQNNFYLSLITMFVGIFIIFSLGTLHLNVVYYHDWSKSISNGFLIFSLWDGVKMVVAAAVATKINRIRMRSIQKIS